MSVGLVAVILIFGTGVVAVIGDFIVKLAKVLKGDSSGGGRTMDADESRLVQEIHQGLSRMEDRLEALETIILGREGKGNKDE